MFDSPLISGDVLREVIAKAPRNLDNLEAELLFIDRNYIFHYLEGNRHVYKSLTPEVLRNAFANEPTDTDWLPKSVIRHGSGVSGNWIVCFFPQQRYSLQVGQEQFYLPLPSFVFMGIGSSYFLWAVKKNQFEPNLIVYHAPLPNIMADGRICWGNVYPTSVGLSNVEAVWSKFIGSVFNRDYTQGKSRKYKNNIIEQLKILNRKEKISSRCRYLVSDLVPVRNKLTVAQAVKAIIKNVECG
ncbi:unknown protein (plasmid) [Stanieria sp. NIES-3757]|nr:unknown protein [Stanieria sp. NIES-3757]